MGAAVPVVQDHARAVNRADTLNRRSDCGGRLEVGRQSLVAGLGVDHPVAVGPGDDVEHGRGRGVLCGSGDGHAMRRVPAHDGTARGGE